jgi:hypothetical protein
MYLYYPSFVLLLPPVPLHWPDILVLTARLTYNIAALLGIRRIVQNDTVVKVYKVCEQLGALTLHHTMSFDTEDVRTKITVLYRQVSFELTVWRQTLVTASALSRQRVVSSRRKIL